MGTFRYFEFAKMTKNPLAEFGANEKRIKSLREKLDPILHELIRDDLSADRRNDLERTRDELSAELSAVRDANENLAAEIEF